MGIYRGLLIAAAALNAAVIVVFIGLAILQFNQIRSDLERERLAIISDRIATPFEAAASIGLPFSTVRRADIILERALQIDDAITAIHLLDANGGLVLGTNPNGAPPEATDARRNFRSPEKTWSGRTGSDFYFGQKIMGPAGTPAGAVLIEYSGSTTVMAAWAMAGQLGTAGALFAAVGAALAAALLRMSLGRDLRSLGEIETAVESFEQSGWRPHEGGSAPKATTGAGSGLRDLLDAAEAKYREAAAAPTRDQT